MEAARALGVDLSAGPPLRLDLDGDGSVDAYVPASCAALRRNGAGWRSERLSALSQPENSVCHTPLRVGARVLVPVTAPGHETDEGRSYTWEEADLIAFPRDAGAVAAWGGRVETNVGHGGDFRFEALGADAVRVSAALGDAAPPGSEGPMSLVLRFDAHGALAPSSCWQRVAPPTAPSGASRCSVRASSSLHLRDAQSLTRETATVVAAGSTLEVLAKGTLLRGVATLHCVRTPRGLTGYVFLTPAETAGCPSLPTVE